MAKSNTNKIILAILMLGIAAVVAFVLTVKPNKPIVDNKPQINQELQPIIPGWKVYQNKECGFRIDYPNNWEIKENTENPIKIISVVSPEILKYTEENLEQIKEFYSSNLDEYFAHNSDISIFYYSSLKDRHGVATIKELTEINDGTIGEVGKIQINGVDAAEFIWRGEGELYAIIFEDSEYFYEIVLNRISSKKSISDTIKQILSTFQLIK